MSEREGKLHSHGLFIHLETEEDIARNDGKHELFARMAEEGTAYQPQLGIQTSRARELVKRWNCHEDLVSMLDACIDSEECNGYIGVQTLKEAKAALAATD
jgi:hypothetical protein